jgi:hypothetical protein
MERLWRREGLKVPQKKRKRRHLGSSAHGCVRRRTEHQDHVWTWDFVFDHTTSGSPWENGYVESFFSRFCDEFLAMEKFESLSAARRLTSAWQGDYNHYRPRSSLGYLTPSDFAAGITSAQPHGKPNVKYPTRLS